ncbi:MAG: (deoxy)nucleoside triphosphate pyrophosphohydrolase [Longicatena sp.]
MKTIRVVGAVIKQDNSILIARRLKGEFKGLWEFPGGKIENSETPQQALIREIKEEMETTINIQEFLMTAEYDYSTFHLSMDCFLCTISDNHIKLNDHSAIQWMPISTPIEQIQWVPGDIQVYNFIQKKYK